MNNRYTVKQCFYMILTNQNKVNSVFFLFNLYEIQHDFLSWFNVPTCTLK